MESKLIAKEKEVVIPAEILAEGLDYLPGRNAYRDGNFIRAKAFGFVNFYNNIINVAPFAASYQPRMGDTVIGRVLDFINKGWLIDIEYTSNAILTLPNAKSGFIKDLDSVDLGALFDVGQVVCAKVLKVDPNNTVVLATNSPGLGRLDGGKIIVVDPSKVPRIIGKTGSMIKILKETTNTRITVGQNGIVWISGEPASAILVEDVIRKIERLSHTEGLTEMVEKYLNKKIKEIQ